MKTLIILCAISLLLIEPMNKKKMTDPYKIEGLTIAVVEMQEMLNFYSTVFSIQFEKKEMFGSDLYAGSWGSLQLLFCPASLAGIDVDRNRQQFDIVVESLETVIEVALKSGGRMLGDTQVTDEFKSGSVFDPDGNSIVFKEYL